MSPESGRIGRACAAVLRNSMFGTEILMVRWREFWTLPGGGIEEGESGSEAAIRELFEETGLRGEPVRELFHEPEECWLIRVDGGAPIMLGLDPEFALDEQRLRGVAWFTLAEKHDDRHVARVIAALSS